MPTPCPGAMRGWRSLVHHNLRGGLLLEFDEAERAIGELDNLDGQTQLFAACRWPAMRPPGSVRTRARSTGLPRWQRTLTRPFNASNTLAAGVVRWVTARMSGFAQAPLCETLLRGAEELGAVLAAHTGMAAFAQATISWLNDPELELAERLDLALRALKTLLR